jgi:hypothetical protein
MHSVIACHLLRISKWTLYSDPSTFKSNSKDLEQLEVPDIKSQIHEWKGRENLLKSKCTTCMSSEISTSTVACGRVWDSLPKFKGYNRHQQIRTGAQLTKINSTCPQNKRKHYPIMNHILQQFATLRWYMKVIYNHPNWLLLRHTKEQKLSLVYT